MPLSKHLQDGKDVGIGFTKVQLQEGLSIGEVEIKQNLNDGVS